MKMKTICVFLLSTVFLPLAVIAAPGDNHLVAKDNAKLTDRPNNSAKVLATLKKGDELMEMDVKGEWYEMYDVNNDLGGWIHVSMLDVGKKGDGQAAAEEDQQSKLLKKFNKVLERYNQRTQELKRYTPFEAAEVRGQDSLYVRVTDEWRKLRRSQRKATLMALHLRWRNIVGYGGVAVYAIDESDEELMRYTGED